MFRFVVSKTDEWIRFLSAVSKITDEFCLNVDEEKLWFRGMDPAHISMIDFSLPKTQFEEYDVDDEEVACVLLDKLLSFVKKTRKDEKLEVSSPEGGGRVKMRVEGNYVREFVTPVLDLPDKSPMDPPNVDYTCSFQITTSALKEALADISIISEKIRVLATEDKVELKGETEEGIQTSVTLASGDVDMLELDVNEDANAVYNVELMRNIVKELEKISGIVNVEFGTELPVELSFEFPEEQEFDFYLAPRIEE